MPLHSCGALGCLTAVVVVMVRFVMLSSFVLTVDSTYRQMAYVLYVQKPAFISCCCDEIVASSQLKEPHESIQFDNDDQVRTMERHRHYISIVIILDGVSWLVSTTVDKGLL